MFDKEALELFSFGNQQLQPDKNVVSHTLDALDGADNNSQWPGDEQLLKSTRCTYCLTWCIPMCHMTCHLVLLETKVPRSTGSSYILTVGPSTGNQTRMPSSVNVMSLPLYSTYGRQKKSCSWKVLKKSDIIFSRKTESLDFLLDVSHLNSMCSSVVFVLWVKSHYPVKQQFTP